MVKIVVLMNVARTAPPPQCSSSRQYSLKILLFTHQGVDSLLRLAAKCVSINMPQLRLVILQRKAGITDSSFLSL